MKTYIIRGGKNAQLGRFHNNAQIMCSHIQFGRFHNAIIRNRQNCPLWYEIPKHFPFVKLGEFVVMPNHVHGIIIINKNGDNVVDDTMTDNVMDNVVDDVTIVETSKLGVSTVATATIPSTNKTGGKNSKWNPGILDVIINQYKRICTINARKTDANYGWQSRFYDHIIRNEESFIRIQQYIINNPQKWDNDRFKNK